MMNNKLKQPSKKNIFILRLLIVLGVISIINFFYWFLDKDLINHEFLYWLLLILIVFDCFRVLYIWYHYWEMSIPVKPVSTKKHTVDILTTYFPGEPLEMITNTLLAIKKIKYSNTAYLCDEENNKFLKEFCVKHDIIHVTRDNRINAKAGNINNALKQAKGDLCLILDPDHIPIENFLDEVVPFFEDDSIGFVQTVQAYYNINESMVAQGAAEQTFHFYGPLMMGMNSYGTVNAIGANCIFRRKALDSIGGHAPGLSEDMHTAMQLHARGWESIYVPQSFTKGLVPSTLTSYYQQQLKWSKGTLELLTEVYPKLFKHFTWRQKIHYGILPLHYLSGLMFLISFLIPIISLFFSITPWKGNIINFGLIIVPILSSVLIIRFYVQQWVIHKSERGVHIIGGLLLQCTWWVFLIGTLYTFIKKKVLYIPTPKSDQDKTKIQIIIPNILIATLSIIAVIYGLQADFTPFSLIMAGFAIWNVFIMLFTIYFAFEKKKVFHFKTIIEKSKRKLRNDWGFIAVNKFALVILFLILISSMTLQYNKEETRLKGEDYKKTSSFVDNKYLGVFTPNDDNGMTELDNVNDFEKIIKENVDIVSYYLAWNKTEDSIFFSEILPHVYYRGSIPMITWEPWINSFMDEIPENMHVYELITEGYFDEYITSFAKHVKKLDKPLYLRFSHEFDNPFYPWYNGENNADETFKKAWIYVHDIFKKNKTDNVIWVWNPWKPENVEAFYPGETYVDWLGVNILNYSTLEDKKSWYSFKQLYDPFNNIFKKLPKTPVMVSEFGSLKQGQSQNKWFTEAFNAIDNEFDEIKALVYFNSKVDNNLPEGYESLDYFDWTINENQLSEVKFKKENSNAFKFNVTYDPGKIEKKNNFKNIIHGVNLKKGKNWNHDYHVLNRENLKIDFYEMKRLGINAINYTENSVYDYNVLKLTKEHNLEVSYGFKIPENLDFRKDTLRLKEIESEILKKVTKYLYKDHINAWVLQNDVFNKQKHLFYKPELFYQNTAYLVWINSLVLKIKNIDKKRPIVLDLNIHNLELKHIEKIINIIPNIDVLGLFVKDNTDYGTVLTYLEEKNINYIINDISVKNILRMPHIANKFSYYISEWQDQYTSYNLTLQGIIDRKGRLKQDYYKLFNFINNGSDSVNIFKCKILKPSKLTYTSSILIYKAMMLQGDEWIYGTKMDSMHYEWSLIKCDKYGNYLTVKDVGEGPTMTLNIPNDYGTYRLLLTCIKDNNVVSTNLTTLNTPYNSYK